MRTLGPGFLEKVYEAALYKELTRRKIPVRRQVRKNIHYKGDFIAVYVADLLVEDKLVIELKCVDRILPEHPAQAINYLKGNRPTHSPPDQLPQKPPGLETPLPPGNRRRKS